ncbi:hypothetical protein SAMN05421780_107150 [Flexibacter flexilis DSM 6793]|uniref:Uncharacterized protein n=1 Tax=Flexibacter flexilis DSM 6793 TaxID=927664 RepID=A0A1I1KV25_9BACT|nr:hypothetical protein SAMN05421780_107150 [Flexibacter flexilis DSM 6793]
MESLNPIAIGLSLCPKLPRRRIGATLFAGAGTTATRRAAACTFSGRFETLRYQVVEVANCRAEKQKHYNIL